MIEKKFWNKKYEQGGISGRGSIGKYRNWKWNKIKQVIGSFRDVIDIGCGDLSFWKHPIANKILKGKGFKYLGIDISDVIINKNKRYNPNQAFICQASHELIPRRTPVVLCLDILFHIKDLWNFEATLERLCEASNKWIVIYTWQNNPFPNSVTDGVSQYFRALSLYYPFFVKRNFHQIRFFQVPYDPYGALYFFKRVIY